MGTITQSGATQKFAGLRKGIDTVFELLAILVIPALFVASVIISMEILPGVATFSVNGIPVGAIIGNTGYIIMMVSIEAAMVGCSVIAKQAKQQGNESIKAKYDLFGWCFFLLFATTLIFYVARLGAEWDFGLTLVRCICAGLYAFVCHGDNHQGPTLTPQQVDRLEALQETIDKLASSVHTLSIQQSQNRDTTAKIIDKLNEFSIQQQASAVHASIDNHGQLVDMEQFKQLSGVVFNLVGTINQMNMSVSEVHSNVLQISNNVSVHTGMDTIDKSIDRDRQVSIRPDRGTEDTCTNEDAMAVKALPVPVLEVPGIPQEKITQVISLRMGGMSWSKIASQTNNNYSRTVKPIRDAYELYMVSIDA